MNERHSQILEKLADRPAASVEELSRLLNVSAVTIRSDLNHLARAGRVERFRGGARLAGERVRQELSFATRQRINAESKRKIGELAASLVQPMDSILLDASTTAVAVAQAIRRKETLKEITVVPTGIWTALELLGSPSIHVLLAGGYVRHTTGSIAGLPASEFLANFHFQKAFLGARGLTPAEGLTDTHLLEIELKRYVVSRAQEVIAVVDGSKFGQVGPASFAAVEDIPALSPTLQRRRTWCKHFVSAGWRCWLPGNGVWLRRAGKTYRGEAETNFKLFSDNSTKKYATRTR